MTFLSRAGHKFVTTALALMTLMLTTTASAQDLSVEQIKTIKSQLTKLGLNADTVTASPMDGLVEVFTDQGLFYTSIDGSYLIQGKVYDISGSQISSLTEETLAKVRVDGMDEFEQSMIVFPAKKEQYQVTVFTDLTCGYCRKLHQQIDEFNDLGITVRYLAFPRGGIGSQSYEDIRSVWCSNDQQKAMTDAKGGAQVQQKICAQPVAEQYEFGRKIGVNGTPAIMLEDGNMLPGYKTPQQLQQILRSMPTAKAG
ncbi:bifunctional protein-disulfide isomerase/oxidoreductase DsbC [Thalassotalea litorea]|uniref:Thiol:disulfide interchange protein n=1 Tax=Thalassotalea litorea TaxID=2020715 RepID=A0A5R9IQW7_9GAMM|nr:bifunctional protein-disulfide isomerase/oxidoreductase DsbC [Thalassotalea litorea]TLU66873.1 bifunctional protein-disulfide isomerase/oxidoreductase DsbC [Thalassotalea litorea]